MTVDRDLVTLVFAIAGGAVALGWLVAYLLPAARERMLDWVGAILLQGIVIALLWYTYAVADDGAFWALLAASWTLNVAATVGWGVHWWVAGRRDPPLLSWVDVLFGGRYALAFVAFGALASLPWLPIVALGATAATVVWAMVRSGGGEAGPRFLGKGLYAILDVALTCVALLVWRGTRWQTLGLLTLAFAAYGAANWINLMHRGEQSNLAAFLWPLSDVVALASVVWA